MTDSDRDGLRRAARLGAAATVSVVLLALALGSVDARGVTAAVTEAPLGVLVAATLAALFFNTVQSAELLRWALRAFGVVVRLRVAVIATVGSLGLQGLLPVGAGAAGRVAYLARLHGVEIGRASVASALILWLKLAWLLAFAAAGWMARPTNQLAHGALLVVALVAVVGGGWLALPIARGLAGRFASGRVGALVVALQRSSASRHGGASVMAVVHAGIAVAAETLIFVGLLVALSPDPDVLTALARFPLCVVGGRVPITLFGVGAREGLVLLLLRDVAAPAELLAAALAFSAVEYVVPAALGTVVTGPFLHRILEGKPGDAPSGVLREFDAQATVRDDDRRSPPKTIE